MFHHHHHHHHMRMSDDQLIKHGKVSTEAAAEAAAKAARLHLVHCTCLFCRTLAEKFPPAQETGCPICFVRIFC